jgi:hypothetical protein
MSGEIISLGTSLRGEARRIWREVEKNVAGCDPNYFFTFFNPQSSGKDVEKEFFVLSVDGDYVGRASATLDKNFGNVGFIEEFMVREDQKDCVDPLIERCLSILKEKGIEEVMVKGGLLLALQTEGYEEIPPFGCPHNPPWYVDLFERNGFSKTREWRLFNAKLPKISKDKAKKFEKALDRLGIKLRPLKARDTKEKMAFDNLLSETNANPYMDAIPAKSEKTSRFALFIGSMVMRFLKVRTFIGIDKNGDVVFFMGYLPDFNQAMLPLNVINEKRSVSPTLYSSLKVPFAIRRVKVCRELGVKLTFPTYSPPPSYLSSYLKVCRERGIGPAGGVSEDIKMGDILNYFVYSMRRDGYEEMIACVAQTDNLAMQPLEDFIRRYEDVKTVGRYAALVYDFKGVKYP